MKFQNFEQTDRRIVGTAGILILMCTLLLWQDSWIYRVVQSHHLDLQEIGEVTRSENDVRRRFEVALSWIPIKKSNEVYQGDSIFTGDNSTVTIRTLSGDEISIAPNSLVVIAQNQNSLSLDIGFGSVEGKVLEGKKILVTSKNQLTEIAGKNASIKVDAGEGNKLLLNVIAGEVKVRSQDGEKILKRDDSTEIQKDGTLTDTTKPSIFLNLPLANQKFKAKEDAPILFSWDTVRPLERMKIKVSRNKDFTDVVLDSPVQENNYSAYNMPKDTPLFWKVMSEIGTSTVAQFYIVGDRPPIPTYPKPGFQFYFDPLQSEKLGVNVDLSWEQGSPSNYFEYQIASDFEFKKIIREGKTKLQQAQTGTLNSGEYFWRTRSVEFPNEKWSEISYFKVGPEPSKTLSPPLARNGNLKFSIVTKIHGRSFVQIHPLQKVAARQYIESFPTLQWSPVAGADRYELQISRNKQFSDIILNETHTNTYMTWKNIEPGFYFWRVRGLSENIKQSLFTSAQTIELRVAPPQSLTQSVYIDEVPDPVLLSAPPPPLKVTWNPTVYTSQYELQFANEPEFKKPFTYITDNNIKSFQVDKPAAYYWRVRSLNNKQIPLSNFSPTYAIEFQRVYKDPAKLKNLAAVYPRQQDSIVLVGQNISQINFRWSNAFPGTTYRIELSYEPEFKTVFFSTATKENNFSYNDPFINDVIYWRIRAESEGFVSDWTAANRFMVLYESKPFNPEDSDALFAARLKARDRQLQILAAQKRRLAQLRTPAGQIVLQLDTPQWLDQPKEFTIESNFEVGVAPKRLTEQPFEKFYSQMRSTPVFRWAKVPAAERYFFEIAKDPDFKTMVVQAPAWDPYYRWETVRPGRYYYRVQAFNDRYLRSQHSQALAMTIEVESPVAVSADQHVEIYNEPRDMWQPPSPFLLSWNPVVFARGYEVEFSEDRNFDIAKVFRTSDTNQEFRVSKSGLYYWRVRPISENGIAIGQFSPTRSLEVLQTQRGPASVGTLSGLFPLNRTMLYVGQGLMNLAFQWASPQPADEYTVEISNQEDFKNIIYSQRSKKPELVLRKDLPNGKIYWRVKTALGASPVYQFHLRRETEPYKKQDLFMNQAGR